MARIYKATDKIKFNVDDLVVTISPLNFAQKMSMQAEMLKAANGDMSAAMVAVNKTLKTALKDIEGLEFEDENGDLVPYKLKFEDGIVTDECIGEILNLPHSQKLTALCTALLNGVPSQILDHEGKPIEGISLIAKETVVKGKK